MKNRFHLPILLFLLFLTVFLRLYGWQEKFSFNAEYNYKLWPMQKMIVEKKPPLIGIEAVSYLHHIHYPPLFLYIFSPILWMSGFNPLSIELAMIFLSVPTAYIFFRLGSEFRNTNFGYLLTFLYAVSFFMQRSDRFIWVVGPIIALTALFLLVLLWLLKKGKIDRRGGFVLGCIVGFGLNFHYQIVLLPLAFTAMLFIRMFRKKSTFFSILLFYSGIGLFLTPLLLFDVRHHFYNLQGLKLLFSYASGGFILSRQIISAFNAFSSVFLSFFIPHSNPSVLASENIGITLITAFLLLFLFFRFIRKQNDESTKLVLHFSFTVCLMGLTVFSLIQNNFNYYLIILEPICMLLLGLIFLEFGKGKIVKMVVSMLFVIFVLNNMAYSLTFRSNPTWKQQIAAFDFIISNSTRAPLSIYFESSASEEYLFLLYYRAQKHKTDFKTVTYYEPWQNGANAEFVVQPKIVTGQEHHFGDLIVLQRNKL